MEKRKSARRFFFRWRLNGLEAYRAAYFQITPIKKQTSLL
jgi:hypothetical protein